MGAASAAYCALSAGSKPMEEVPKAIPAWQVWAFRIVCTYKYLRLPPFYLSVQLQ